MLKKTTTLTFQIAIAVLLSLTAFAFAQTSTDDFDRPDGALGANWTSDTDLVIASGKLHNQSAGSDWLLAIYDGNGTVTNPDEVTINWATTGDGVQWGGAAFVNTNASVGAANGYLVQYRLSSPNKIRLWKITSGALDVGAGIVDEVTASGSAPTADAPLKVNLDPATYTLQVYVDDVIAGSVQDAGASYDLTNRFGAVVLASGSSLNNDVEDFTVGIETPDNIAPNAVSDLSATATGASTVLLEWTASGDDGATGQASQYDIRYSTSPIATNTDFSNAQQVNGEPTPQITGSDESFVVNGLNASTTYYFCLKVGDDNGNFSAISNSTYAATEESGGTGSEGGLLTVTDDFERADLGTSWAATAKHQIKNGTLDVIDGTSTDWNNLAVYKGNRSVSPAGVSIWLDDTECSASGALAVGTAILLDSPSSSASGYFILRRTSSLELWDLSNGVVGAGGRLARDSNPDQPDPTPGDRIKVMVTGDDDTGTITIDVYVNDYMDGQFILNGTEPSTWYAGVFQHGSYANNIDAFTIYSDGSSAEMISEYYGNGQAGPIQATLSDSIAVQVTDGLGNPAAGTVVNFDIVNGDATLSIDSYDYGGLIWKEVEDGAILSPAVTQADANASNGTFVLTPNDIQYSRQGGSVMNLYVPEAGNFNVWLRVIAPSSTSNSLFLRVNDGDTTEVKWGNTWTSWRWEMLKNISLAKGFNQVSILTREEGTQFDKIVLAETTKQPGYTPTGTGGSGSTLPNVTDVNGIAYTFVTFLTNADDDVVIEASAFKDDGSTALTGSPVTFTLDPISGSAVSIVRDPAQPDTLLGEPIQQMTTPLRAYVRDSFGNGVSGVSVSWAITEGTGTLSSSQNTTGNTGTSETYLTLSAQNTPYTIQATAAGLSGSPVSFYVKPGDPPTEIQQTNPTTQVAGDAGVELTEILTVRVITEDGTPFPGFPVNYVVTEGDGALSSELGSENATEIQILSDENGYARARWVLGDEPGLNRVEAQAEGLTNSPILFEALGEIGDPSLLTIIDGNNQSGPLGLALQEPFIVKLTDQVGNGIPNQNIEYRILQGSGATLGSSGLTVRNVKTDAEGVARDTLVIGNQVGQTHQVQVSVAGNSSVSAQIFYATATAAIASEIVYVSGNGVKVGTAYNYQSSTVNTTLAQDFIVQVNGPFGNDPIAGHAVTFRVVSGGGNFYGNNSTTVSTGPDGRASARLTLGSVAGDSVHIVEATANRVDNTTLMLNNAPIIFKADGTASDPNKITKMDSTDNQTGIVGDPLTKQVQALVSDIYGNPISGHQVTFQIINNGGALQGSTGEPAQAKQVTTNAKGIASIIWVMPTTPGQVQMQAFATTATSNPLTGSPITYTAYAGVDAAYEMVRVTGQDLSGIVGQPLAENASVKIVDQYSNAVSSYPVTFTITDGNGLVNGSNQVTVQTGTNGIASVEWTLGTESGFENNAMEATSSVSMNNKETFTASGLADVAFRMIADSTYDTFGIVGELLDTPIKVLIVDQYDNPVADYPVTFEIDDIDDNVGFIETEGTLSKVESTDDDGYAQIRWGLGPNPGSQNNKLTVTTKRNNIHLINSPYNGFVVSAQAGNAYQVIKVTDDVTKELSSVHGSTLPEYLKVKVVDKFGTPIARHPVTFQVLSRLVADGGTLDGSVDTVKVKETDSNGIASVQFTLGLNAGSKINQVQYVAELNGENLEGSPGTFEITGLSSTATQIVKVAGDEQPDGIVGQFWDIPLQVAAKDKNGNYVAGQPVSFKILPKEDLIEETLGSLGAGTATDTTILTNAEGLAIINWRAGHLVGEYQVQVTSFALAELAGSPMTFTATAFAETTDADQSMISVNPDSLNVSDGSIRSTIVVTLKDKYGNPVQNKGVTLQASGTGNIITQPATASNSNGQVTGYIASENSGLKNISARDINNEVDMVDKAQVYFRASEADRIVKHPTANGDGQKRNVGTVLENPLQVVVEDSYGNPIPNFPVVFTVTGAQTGGQIVENVNVTTDENGVASRYYRLGTVKGINTIQVTAQGISGSSVIFNVESDNPVDLQKPVIVSGDSARVSPAQPLPEDLVVQVVDERGWPVWNEGVLFEALSTNDGQITSSNPHNTDWYGYARAQAQVGTKVGINLFSAKLEEYPGKGTVTFYAWTVSASTAKYLTFVSGPTSGVVGQSLSSPVIMKTTDEYDNPVQNVTVTFLVVDDASVDGAGTLQGGLKSVTKQTDSNGEVSIFYTLDTVSGINKIRVSSLNLEPSSYVVTITGNADSPYRMEKFSGDNQRGEMSKHLFNPIYVMVRDRYGNPAPGGVVTFTVTQGDGSIDGDQSVQSNSNGLARAYWVLGPRPYAVNNSVQVTSSYLQGGPLTFNATGDDQNYPEFSSLPSNVEVFELANIRLEISATDEDGENVFYNSQNLPSGASFEMESNNKYYFKWTPGLDVVNSPDVSQTFYPIFIAQDDHDPSGRVKDSVKVVIKNYNRPPEITKYTPEASSLDWNQDEVASISFSIETNDLDNDPLTVTWYVGDTQVEEGHNLTLTSGDYENGVYTVKVSVSDQFATTEKLWQVTTSLVELSSFSAVSEPYKGITVEWETASEIATAGFNVLRSLSETGTFEKINEDMILPNKEKIYSIQDKEVQSGQTYYYKLEDVSLSGLATHHGPISVEAPVPKKFSLSQNYPNPFNPVTTIQFELPKHTDVTIEVYNIMGQMVNQLINTRFEAGYHTVQWDGTNSNGMRVGSGVYYYRIIAGDFKNVKKMVLLK